MRVSRQRSAECTTTDKRIISFWLFGMDISTDVDVLIMSGLDVVLLECLLSGSILLRSRTATMHVGMMSYG